MTEKDDFEMCPQEEKPKPGAGESSPGSDETHLTADLTRAQWQGVLDSVQDAIISIDPRGRITLFNKAAERIFGYRGEEVLGQNVKILMPPPYCDEHDRYLEAYHQTGVPRAIGLVRYVEALRKGGEKFPIELSVSEARIGDRVVYTAIIRDVTERVRTDAALRASEAKLRAIVDTAVDAIITIDEEGAIESFNRAAERLFGYGAAEVLGHNVRILMPAPYRDEHDQSIRNYLRTGVPTIIGIGREVMGQRKNGTTFRMDLAVSEVRLEERRVFTGIIRDLTERRLAETRLLALERQLQEHELTAVRGGLTTKASEVLTTLSRLECLVRDFARLATVMPDETAKTSEAQEPPASSE